MATISWDDFEKVESRHISEWRSRISPSESHPLGGFPVCPADSHPSGGFPVSKHQISRFQVSGFRCQEKD
jgi:hypothetical protein